MICLNRVCGHLARFHAGLDDAEWCRVTGCACQGFQGPGDAPAEPQFADINIRLPLDGKAYTFTISGKEQLDAEPE